MRRETPSHFSRSHHCLLSSGARLRRTFGGMLIVSALLLLGFGGYLIEDQFADPLGSNPAGLFFAAAMIALALVLLSYVIHPGARHEPKAAALQILEIPERGPTIEIRIRERREPPGEHPELPLQSRYVDHSRIRP